MPSLRPTHVMIILALSLAPLTPTAGAAYRPAPPEIQKILDEPLTAQPVWDDQHVLLALATAAAAPTLADLARPMVSMAGSRVDPTIRAPFQATEYVAVEIHDLVRGGRVRVHLPEPPRAGDLTWSLDGRRLLFTQATAAGTELWEADPTTGRCRRLVGPRLSAVLGSPFLRLRDPSALVVRLVPEGAPPLPADPPVPTTPLVDETAGARAATRTWQDLIVTPRDEERFVALGTSQVAVLSLSTLRLRPLGHPGLLADMSISPDGLSLLVTRVTPPFSRAVPWELFGRSHEVWPLDGGPATVVASQAAAEEVPIGGVRVGPRGVDWLPCEPATVAWVEALDGGDPEREVPHRDRLMTLTAPFTASPREAVRLTHRFAGVDWLETRGQALLTEHDWRRRWLTTRLFDLGGDGAGRILFDRSEKDVYGAPGSPLHRRGPRGEWLVRVDEGRIWLTGEGSSDEGDRPFLRSYDLTSGETVERFRATTTCYETVQGFVGTSGDRILTRWETPTVPPTWALRSLATGRRERSLTARVSPSPELSRIRPRILTYGRADGVPLSGILYLPPDLKPGEQRPAVVWAYPRSYSDPDTAGQIRGASNRFTLPRGPSHLFFLLHGYVVLDRAQIPVVGDPMTMNDTFVDQIVAGARAAVDALEATGAVDPHRVGVGGHSYGAFMTANLLAHCDLFAAGIARSGAYNRTLTPFGFQNERRTLWQAPGVYAGLSPFMHADLINEPLLLVHGERDPNPGTFPMQSERLFGALKGTGGTARLVVLPLETHGYQARESVGHVVAEMFDWFDRHVRDR